MKPLLTYTIGTQVIHTGKLGALTSQAAPCVLQNGKMWIDFASLSHMSIAELVKLVAELNQEDAQAIAYRAQFATEEEWQKHLDENAKG